MVNSMAHAELKNGGKPPRPTEHFRSEHLELKKHLSEVEQWVSDLQVVADASKQKDKLSKITAFFKEHIEPHAEWEERRLYPAVDKRTCTSPGFTATMRHEHKIVARWISDLQKETSAKSPDLRKFSRKADQLLGLIKAHFEEEEEILLPVLDKSMTPEQFKQEILGESDENKSHKK